MIMAMKSRTENIISKTLTGLLYLMREPKLCKKVAEFFEEKLTGSVRPLCSA